MSGPDDERSLLRRLPGFTFRFVGPIVAGAGLGILAAANWPNPDSPAAGVALALSGLSLGVVVGFAWTVEHGDWDA